MSSPTPPLDVEMAILGEDNPQHPAPPARVAARFYRNSSARRRSSAHSSRRSSLSSVHSHQSALSCHGGPRSTHIAQHLRRASIIESRKARLADRAVHAEQVRLRAAAAKAAPRVSYSEEKAQAAQAAREKLLAEITARCEEEVRRAKKVAEETKEKRAAELARMKEEMTEKYAEAARRRSIYQNNLRRPRTASLAAVEEKKFDLATLKKLSQTAAARVIQRSWRAHRRTKTIKAFLGLGLNMARTANMSFEDLTRLLSEDRIMSSTAAVLTHTGLLERSTDEAANKGATRVFLSAFMVRAHPQEAFSHGGREPQEQDLMTKATAVLTAFEKCLNADCSERLAVCSSEDLSFLYNDFTSAFHAWKSQDLTVLIDVMVNSFVSLDQILQVTKDEQDGNVAEDYLQAVRQEQIKLLARLKKLAGSEEALNKVRTAVRKARKQKAAKERRTSAQSITSTQNVPRAITPVNDAMVVTGTAALTPPATPKPEVTRASGASSFMSRLGQAMTVLPSNREIAHEMQINGTYEVQQQPWTDSRKQFMEMLRNSMRESMQEGGDRATASWTHAMAVLIRDKLLALVSQKHPLHDHIDGFLDPQLIDQQCRIGMFSYAQFFDTIAGLIAQICSPGRDEAVKQFLNDKTGDTIDRLFALIDIIDLMTLDHINFQFRLASQSVIEHGHEHEHSMFQKDLDENLHTLDRTRQWWRNARLATAAPTPNGNAIYARGLVDLVFGNTHMDYNSLPETLRLDWTRLLKLRGRVFQVVATASILLTSKIRMRRNREALWSKDADRLMSLDLLTTDASRIVSVIESSHIMPETTKEGLLNFVNRVLPAAIIAAQNAADAEAARLSAIQNSSDYDPSAPGSNRKAGDVFTEQIATFVLKSLREHVFSRLSAGSTAEKVRATTVAAEVLARAGMPEFVAEVGVMVDLLDKVRSIDLRAHGKWYDQIATPNEG